MNVLVVEADVSLRRSLEFAFAMRGHLAESAETGAAALRAAANQQFPLVIVGQLDELRTTVEQLCRDLRRLPGYEHSSILVTGSRDDASAILDLLDAGANGYLTRTIDATQLRARIEDVERRLVNHQPAPERPSPAGSDKPDPPHDTRLLELAADLVVVLEPSGQILRVAHYNERVLGPRAVPLGGASIYALCHPEDAAHVMAFLTSTLDRPAGSQPSQTELRFLHQDGTWRAMDVSAANLGEQAVIGGIALVARDITHRRAAEQEIRRQALYDPLTNLPNRALFFTYLEHALARADRRSEPVVVMFLDIDDFALINERHGREAGDTILTIVGERLRTALRATDTAARMSDDEFTILLEDVSHLDEARVVAGRVSDALRIPYEIDGRQIDATASIGVVFSHPASRLPNVPSDMRLGELLRQADAALYRAKSSGKDRWVLYDSATHRPPSSLPSDTDLSRSL